MSKRSEILHKVYGTYWNYIWDIPLDETVEPRPKFKRKGFQPFNFILRRRPRIMMLAKLLGTAVVLFGGISLWGVLTYLPLLGLFFGWYMNWIGKFN